MFLATDFIYSSLCSLYHKVVEVSRRKERGSGMLEDKAQRSLKVSTQKAEASPGILNLGGCKRGRPTGLLPDLSLNILNALNNGKGPCATEIYHFSSSSPMRVKPAYGEKFASLKAIHRRNLVATYP